MTLQQLRYVIAIVQEGSFNMAARQLFISQPSLSKSMGELEKEMGIVLFRRTSRGALLTEEGVKFLSYARQVVEQADRLENAYKKGPPLFKTSIHVFLSRRHPLSSRSSLTLEDLAPYPRLTYEQGIHNSLYFSEEPLIQEYSPKNIIVTDRATLFNLLIGLDGYTICSGILSEDLNGTDILSLPLESSEEMTLGYITLKGTALRGMAARYMDHLKSYISHLEGILPAEQPKNEENSIFL